MSFSVIPPLSKDLFSLLLWVPALKGVEVAALRGLGVSSVSAGEYAACSSSVLELCVSSSFKRERRPDVGTGVDLGALSGRPRAGILSGVQSKIVS